MTILRQRMTEDMQVRNLSPHTQASYLQQVSLFARYFCTSPELLTPEHIRTYQLYLTNEKKLATSDAAPAAALAGRARARWQLIALKVATVPDLARGLGGEAHLMRCGLATRKRAHGQQLPIAPATGCPATPQGRPLVRFRDRLQGAATWPAGVATANVFISLEGALCPAGTDCLAVARSEASRPPTPDYRHQVTCSQAAAVSRSQRRCRVETPPPLSRHAIRAAYASSPECFSCCRT